MKQGRLRLTTTPGFVVTLIWQYPERSSDVLIEIITNDAGLRLAVRETLRAVVSRVSHRVLSGNPLEPNQIL